MANSNTRDIQATFDIEMYWDESSLFPDVYPLNQNEEAVNSGLGNKNGVICLYKTVILIFL